ncbi:MAG: thermonuclease family protein [Acidobacteriota bacterium]|nr:thermonuclease family protein [Acidobacteriota bacterium]
MKNAKLIFLAWMILCAASSAFAQTRVGGRVIEIVDGRTVVIQTFGNDRLTAVLQYIEVPEAEQPLHQIARDHLQTLVLDKKVEFRARGLSQTKTVGQLLLNGVDVSQQMIRDGAAWYAVLEKNAQDYTESKIYQTTEDQAKSEKLGIWSIAGLKPSWQIRAEAEEIRRQQERTAQEEQEKAALKASAAETPSKPKPVVKGQLNSESQLLAIDDSTIKLPANIKSVGGLLVGYNPAVKLGLVATPLLHADFADQNGEQELAVQIVYLYFDGEENKGRQSVYKVFVESESKDIKFLKYNDLILTADRQKIIIGKAKRREQRNDYGVKETLVYEIKKSVFTKIANAQNLEIKVGGYSKMTNSQIQATLHNLLQTSL